jgi:phospholipid/cholesterol/gamma-HCH transport system substrate-binding protein
MCIREVLRVSRVTKIVAGVIAAVLVIGGAIFVAQKSGEYRVKFLIPSAAQLVDGSPVLIRGFKVGKVDSLEVQDGKALVTATISGDDVPLHDGTTTMVEWTAALGERVLTIFPGPTSNAAVPEGGMIIGASRQIEVDQVLSALDTPTRAKLTSLLQQLDATVNGTDQDMKATLQSAGPTAQALGDVLAAVGKDGPAIKQLVGQLQNLVHTAVERQNKISGTINNLADFTNAASAEQEQLAAGLRELPDTLKTADTTLQKVHPASEATVPLLNDLRPGIGRLVGVSRDLAPLMHDLQPAADRLVPTVWAAHDLLGKTPGLLDSASDDLPTIKEILRDYQPAASFIRPYAPELAGFLSNWAAAFGSYDSQGHYWAGIVDGGLDAFHEFPTRLPGQIPVPAPKPGEIGGQPWNDPDATGSGPR